ncbi:adenosine receptor A2a-like isoform X2 [Amphiura filiformis]|uniref:adenosine receptor A2a-like isoform X2 n=1 Tax=Amphiura filiformis TaxID=82378 RepID=UPI003B212DBF
MQHVLCCIRAEESVANSAELQTETYPKSKTTTMIMMMESTNGSAFPNEFFVYTPVPETPWEFALNALQLLIGVIGAVGNGLVCVVIWKVRRQQNYTNSLIVSQSAIDFVTSILLIANIISLSAAAQPPENFTLAVLYCTFWHSRVILFGCWAISTFNLTAIAIERYLAIMHPIWYQQTFTRKHAWILATTAWLIAPIMETIGGKQYVLEQGRCAFVISKKEKAILGVLTVLWDYAIPASIMAFAFIRIAIRLNQVQNSALVADDDQLKEKILKRKNITKTLFFVFALYIICWTPEQISYLQFTLGGRLEFGGVWHTIALILATSNSAVNPFVYALRFKQYKEGVKSLCSKLKKCSNHSNPN